MVMQSSSSSFSYGFTYDVFLSFRGEDTRYGFTGYLYKALSDRGIYTFIDDQQLPRGDQITSALEKAIEESRIFIIVLSENYAFSSFCLNELVYILNFIKGKGLLVLPVFYKVDPSDVRHHTGSFGKALANHEKMFNANKETFKSNMEKLETWKMALNQAANLSGYHFRHRDGYEYEIVQRIVELVSEKINRAPLNVADCPVGLESQVRKVRLLLDVGSDVVHIVGIHGLSGVGVGSAEPDLKKSEVSMKGVFEAAKLVEHVYKRTGKHAVIVKQEAEKKEEAAKEANKGEKKEEEGDMNEKGSGEGVENKEKKEAEGEAKPEEAATEETTVEAEEGEKNEKGSGEGEENKEKKEAEGETKPEEAATEETTVVAEEGEKSEKGSGEGEENKVNKEAEGEAKPEEAATEEDMVVELEKIEYYYNLSPKYGMEYYTYPLHIFSDENPHACSIM